MDKLKEEIARKKRQLQEKQLISSERKHFRREELLKIEQQEYYAKSAPIEAAGESPADAGKNKQNEQTTKSAKDEIIFPRKEVVRRLRERNEPILLFAETEHDAFLRLKHLELINPDHTKGQVNDFQQALERVDEVYINEMLKMENQNENVRKKMHDVKVEEMNLGEADLERLAGELGRKDKPEADAKIVCTFLKFILEIWGKNLNRRPDEEKAKTSGRIAAAMYTQTTDYLKPLFKQLNKNKLSDDILRHLINICKFMMERDYVQASSAYLQMAIGNAPWPIGVTMVGIHARTGREKIFAQNIAHVLNDETQRKYIQGLKRLMTQCQYSFPTDPSKCVEYMVDDK